MVALCRQSDRALCIECNSVSSHPPPRTRPSVLPNRVTSTVFYASFSCTYTLCCWQIWRTFLQCENKVLNIQCIIKQLDGNFYPYPPVSVCCNTPITGHATRWVLIFPDFERNSAHAVIAFCWTQTSTSQNDWLTWIAWFPGDGATSLWFGLAEPGVLLNSFFFSIIHWVGFKNSFDQECSRRHKYCPNERGIFQEFIGLIIHRTG